MTANGELQRVNPVMRISDGVSLKDYVDLRFLEHQRAIDKAEASMSTRLAGMNEFRDQLKDQAARLLSREEYASAHGQITGVVNELRDQVQKNIGRPEWSAKCDMLEVQVKELRTIADMARGKASQSSVLVAGLFSIVGIVLGLVHLFK